MADLAELSAIVVRIAEAELTAAEPGYRWDAVAGYPLGDHGVLYAVSIGRLPLDRAGRDSQPFLVVRGSAPQYPEEAEHLGRVCALAAQRNAERFDNPGIERLPVLHAAWAAHHGR